MGLGFCSGWLGMVLKRDVGRKGGTEIGREEGREAGRDAVEKPDRQ